MMNVGEQDPLLVVWTTEDLVIIQIELVSHTKPVTTLLTSKTLEMIHIGPGSHHHLECWDHLVTRGTVASGAKQPEIVSLAEEQVPLGVEGVPHLPQPAVTAPALQTVLVPVHVQSL